MKITRLYTGDDSKSYFEEIDIAMHANSVGEISEAFSTQQILFGTVSEVRELNWHNTPCKQFIIMLKGNMEIEVSDGTKKIFYPGDILLAEDTTGQGHMTRAASDGIREYLLVQLP